MQKIVHEQTDQRQSQRSAGIAERVNQEAWEREGEDVCADQVVVEDNPGQLRSLS